MKLVSTAMLLIGTAGAILLFTIVPSFASPWPQDSDNTTVSVEVTSTKPTSSTSATPSASSSPSSTSSSSAAAPTSSQGAPTSSTTEPTASSSTEPTPSTGEQNLGGVLYVSGLTCVYTPSINPLAGSLDLHFTVRNVSTKPATGSAHMWLTGILGVPVGQAADVAVADLKPGETRVVAARIESLAQWTVVTASATFTPPPELDGAVLTPLTRATTVWYVPWFMLAVIAALSIALVVVRRRRIAREAAELIQAADAAAARGDRR